MNIYNAILYRLYGIRAIDLDQLDLKALMLSPSFLKVA